MSCSKTERHAAVAETRTQDLSAQSRRPWSPRHDALHGYGVCNLDVGTLRVVTARELVALSCSVTFHSRSVRRRRHLRGHAATRDRRFNLQKPIPRATGIEPGAAAWQGRTLPLRYCSLLYNTAVLILQQVNKWESAASFSQRVVEGSDGLQYLCLLQKLHYIQSIATLKA